MEFKIWIKSPGSIIYIMKNKYIISGPFYSAKKEISYFYNEKMTEIGSCM